MEAGFKGMPNAALPVLFDTEANIVASNPKVRFAVATDTLRLYVSSGTRWYVLSSYLAADGPLSDLGYLQSSNRSGYGPDYVTDKLLASCTVGSFNATPSSGAIRVVSNVLSAYLNAAWTTVVTNFVFAELAGVLQHTPVGYATLIDVFSGNSVNLGLNGLPLTQGYKTSIGAYPQPAQIDGGTF